MRRRLGNLCVAAALVLLAFAVPTVPAGAQTPAAPTTDRTVVSAAPEYFTDAWADPFDLANNEDWDPTPGRRAVGVAAAVGGGRIDYTTTSGFGRLYFVDVEPTEMNALGHRQATFRSVQSGQYRRLAIRAWTDRNIVAYVVWNHCSDGNSNPVFCQGTKAVNLRAGWHLYDLDMTGANDRDSFTDPGLPTSVAGSPWAAAPVVQLSLQPSVSGTAGVHGFIEDVRIYEPGIAMVNVATTRTGTQELWYDTDTNVSNNGTSTDEGEGAGVIRTLGQGTTAVDMGALQPTIVRLMTRTGGQFSAQSAAFGVDGPPRPVVVDPDMAGAGDWFSEVRGNAMDFNDPFDVFAMFDGATSIRNASVGIGGGLLQAGSAGRYDDPQVFLTDAWWNGPTIDATEWHRLSWRIQYAGSWGTNPSPGEGLDMRFCWQGLAGQASCSKDVFPALGPVTYGVDLRTFPPNAIEPGGYSGIGWGGGASPRVQLLRLDPHEDPGYRTWYLDDVRLAHDDRMPYGGSFNIRFRDDNWESGTTAQVFIDGDPGPGLGQLVASGVSVKAGENSVPWNGAGFGPGVYNVNIVLTDPKGAARLGQSTGLLDLPAPERWAPNGTLDSVAVSGRTLVLGGWVADPDAPRSPTSVHVYVDSAGYDLGLASSPRGDVAAALAEYGPSHGYYVSVPASAGTHTVCSYGINIGYGYNNQLGCRTVVVK